jgi:hypothetical protein
MNSHALSYPSQQRRLFAERRSRALFLRPSTQHLSRTSPLREVVRAAIALLGVALWGTVLALLVA